MPVDAEPECASGAGVPATQDRAQAPAVTAQLQPGGRPLIHRVAQAAVAGAVLAWAFPPGPAWQGWACIPALAVLVGAFRATPRLSARQGALLGAAGGFVFYLVLLTWLQVLGLDAWVMVPLICTPFWSLAGALLPRILSQRWWPVGVPLLWVTLEAVLGRFPWGGFPWGRLAYPQAGTPLRGWAVLAGAPLVTFVVATLACLLLALVTRPLPGVQRGLGRAVALGSAAAILIAGGAVALTRSWGGPVVSTSPMAIVQGNVPRAGLDFNAQRRAVLDNHVRVTEELAAAVAAGTAEQPQAVIWPENSSDLDPFTNPDAAAEIDRAADANGVPILIGAVMTNPADPTTVLNVSLVWDPRTGPGERYVKRHPVPFGEYLPMRPLLTRFISRFDRIPRDFAPGSEPGMLELGGIPTSVAICFEIAYDGVVRDAVAAGGEVLVVQTNNATYALTGQPEQQLAITTIQAVASGRTTLVAATSGISAVVDERGDVRWRTAQLTSDWTVADVPLRSGLTPATRLGDWPDAAAALALGLLLLASRRTSGSPLARPRRPRQGDRRA